MKKVGLQGGPEVKVHFPGPKTKELLRLVRTYESPGGIFFTRYKYPPVARRAKGVFLEDVDGNVYLDLTSGFGALNAGHCHPLLIETVIAQLKELHHTASLPNEVRIRLAREINNIAPGSLKNNCRVQFGLGGTGAVEIAIKIARAYTKRPNIISFYGAYHGKSIGTLALTSDAFAREGFYPIMPGGIQIPYPYCYRCYFNLEYPKCKLRCVQYLERILTDPSCGLRDGEKNVNSVAAIIMEPIQGNGGYIVPPEEFWPRIRKLCDDYDILLIDDEIQMGFGRTGKMFCIENWNVTPDVVIMGKGMTGGVFPASAVAARYDVIDSLKPGQEMVTFEAMPLGCAAALSMIKILRKEKLLDNSVAMGDYFVNRLRKLQISHSIIGNVEGKGLAIGVEFVRNRENKEPASEETKRIVEEAINMGLILTLSGRHNNRINIAPPLIIEKEQVDSAIEILDEVITRVAGR